MTTTPYVDTPPWNAASVKISAGRLSTAVNSPATQIRNAIQCDVTRTTHLLAIPAATGRDGRGKHTTSQTNRMDHDKASHKVQQAMNDLCILLVNGPKLRDVVDQLNDFFHPPGFVGQCENAQVKIACVDANA